MRASLLTRAGSVAAAAAIATTGAMATAGAASASTHQARHHARRLPTHLSAGKARAAAHRRHVFVIAGRLTTFGFPLRDRLVVLDRIVGRSLVRVGHGCTNRAGVAAFVVDPKVTARFVLIFEGTRHLHSSHSRIVVVRR
jgi:hypothetical protein